MRKKVLITGFDPFDKETVNPSWEAAKQLNGLETDEAIITAEQIPTVFRTALDTLRQAILKHQPDIVICVGQAGGGCRSRRNGWQSILQTRASPITKDISRLMKRFLQEGPPLTGRDFP